MTESPMELRAEQRWIRILRDLGTLGHPPRSEGLELIESAGAERFLEASWDELLLEIDFFFRLLLRVEADDGFVAEWQSHAGGEGNGRTRLLQRITAASTQWLSGLDHAAAHHQRGDTEPSSTREVPRTLFASSALLDFLIDPDVGRESKFRVLGGLGRLAVSHSSISSVVAQMKSQSLPETAADALLWIHSISLALTVAGRHSPPTLAALAPDLLAKVEQGCDQVAARYEIELLEDLRTRGDPTATNRRNLVVDAPLVCDICVIRTVAAFARASRSEREGDWKLLGDWLAESRRVLQGSPERRADLVGWDLSNATSWVQPNFGSAWPGCIAEAEDMARAFLATLIGRRDWADVGARTGVPGSLIDMVTPTEVVRFRIPGSEVEPPRAASQRIGAAFTKHPLLTWLLFPSTGVREGWRFWRDGAYGAMTAAFEDIDTDENHPMRMASRRIHELAGLEAGSEISHDLASALFPDLPEEGARAAAAMAASLLAVWPGWAETEHHPSDQISSMPGA